MFDFKDKVVVITGGARGIGKCIREQFVSSGADVCIVDLLDNDYFVGDIADKTTLEAFAKKVIAEHGHVDYLINNAAPLMCGIESGSYDADGRYYSVTLGKEDTASYTYVREAYYYENDNSNNQPFISRLYSLITHNNLLKLQIRDCLLQQWLYD